MGGQASASTVPASHSRRQQLRRRAVAHPPLGGGGGGQLSGAGARAHLGGDERVEIRILGLPGGRQRARRSPLVPSVSSISTAVSRRAGKAAVSSGSTTIVTRSNIATTAGSSNGPSTSGTPKRPRASAQATGQCRLYWATSVLVGIVLARPSAAAKVRTRTSAHGGRVQRLAAAGLERGGDRAL